MKLEVILPKKNFQSRRGWGMWMKLNKGVYDAFSAEVNTKPVWRGQRDYLEEAEGICFPLIKFYSY